MARGQFDAETFYSALDAIRIERGLTWKKVAERAGITASTLTRMAQGRRPDVDSLASLLNWSGLNLAKFTQGEPHAVRPSAAALEEVTALFRRDPNLTPEAADAIETTVKVLYEKLRGDQRR